MRINHNIASLNTYNLLSANTQKTSKAIEKLSSGLRINRAGDDAAGLAISEKMRGQIRGLNQASRNAQDGISLIQTAEGALNETHDTLQRMRELAVQANNDTNNDEDRNKIKFEISQLTSEIDRIANNTEFNTIKLLNSGGDSSSSSVKDHIIEMLKTGGWLELAEEKITSAFGLTGSGAANLNIIFTNGGSGGSAAYVTGSTGTIDQSMTIDLDDMSPSSGEDGDNGTGGANYTDRVIAHEMVHAVMNDSFTVSKTIDMQKWFKEGSAELIHGGDERLKSVISDGAGSIDNSKLNSLITRATDLLNGAVWNGDNTDYAAGYLVVSFLNNEVSTSGNTMSDVMGDIKLAITSGDQAVKDGIVAQTGSADFNAFVSKFSTNAANYVQNDMTIDFSGLEADTGSIAGSDHGGAALNAEDVISESNANDTDGNPLQGFRVIFPSEKQQISSIIVHIGSNASQSLTIDLNDMRAGALGINSEDSFNITMYDNAIEKVSSFRSSLGALQNRLEHSINNLGASSENLTASESRIRDVDMAQEMMIFTKNNILSQAAQSMLAQANSLPQGVLQLLR